MVMSVSVLNCDLIDLLLYLFGLLVWRIASLVFTVAAHICDLVLIGFEPSWIIANVLALLRIRLRSLAEVR